MVNMRVRLAARGAGVPLWRVAQEMGISEPTLTRMLRNELPEEGQARFLSIVKRLGKNILLHEQTNNKQVSPMSDGFRGVKEGNRAKIQNGDTG